MTWIFTKIALVGIAALLYWLIFSTMRKTRGTGSRAAQFKVGGKKPEVEGRQPESREDRQKRLQVSLRDGPRFKRRFR
ncbi:MAG: hypothetical protein A3F83_08490 [Candidatus Glassbacteria bacterium RIFCSPLOWO2_12_FULL_58_11]|uniref:Uncharacterized protein n=1 Tax=Candidatus Glassbacteria bacterium RIFCSPLOWO2_12_FULL_58_11 TaxID=1817867 RepID=A0A1F5YYK2_9BACT|nr:MAG: hypothetical protein A3F83_08490 [Candidatus Glassbacteria bacterium RIFCSPLOWO2_12_FULL_58_11]